MDYLVVLFLILGLIIGSFLNVCIFRIPKEESISFPPSHCVKCGTKIKLYDLIPIISYIFLKGRCRNCKDKISLKYPIIELITGALFVALYIEFGLNVTLIKFLFLVSLLLVIGIIDFETMDVYFNTICTGIIAGVIFMAVGAFFNNFNISYFSNYIIGGAVGGSVISIIILITKGMGWGDAEICLVAGLFLGFKLTLVMLFLAFVIGGVFGIALLLLKIKKRSDPIPFGPFIALAGIITVFAGNFLLKWYMTMIF